MGFTKVLGKKFATKLGSVQFSEDCANTWVGDRDGGSVGEVELAVVDSKGG